MNAILKYSGVVALVILAILGVSQLPSPSATLGTAIDCGDTTCFTKLGALTSFQSDGTSIFNGAVTLNAAVSAASVALTTGVFTQGGGITATSTDDTTATLLASDFDAENVIDFTPNVTGITLALPASTTLPLGTTAGQTRTILIRNATTTAAANVTVAGGTGTLLKVASSSPSAAIIYGDTDAGNYATIILVRKANSDIEALFQSFKD